MMETMADELTTLFKAKKITGALLFVESLRQLQEWDSLTSKLDGYPSRLSLIPYGVKPVHNENCLGIKLRQRRIKSAHPCICPKAVWNALT